MDPYWADLVAAFQAAPDFFKDNLCDLDKVFVVQHSCPSSGCTADDITKYSWGLRAWRGAGKYIATSAALWQGGGAAPVFSDFETKRLQAVLAKLSSNAKNWQNSPAYSATPDSSGIAVLAVLAHEFGHVLWFDDFVSRRGGPADRVGIFCNGKNKYNRFYSPVAWTSTISIPTNVRWIEFGERRNAHRPDYVSILKSDLDSGDFVQSGEDIHLIMQAPNLVSVLSSFSPDEEFVELFELTVLRNALTSDYLQIYDINGNVIYSEDVLAKFSPNTDVSEKAKCF